MPNQPMDSQIRSRVDAFVTEVSSLVRGAALEAVSAALGNGRSVSAPRRAARKTGRKTGTMRRGGRRARRSPEDLAGMADAFLTHVRSNPGQRLEEISAAIGESTADLKQPVAMLLTERRVSRKGKARGTTYFAGGRSGAKKASRKKAGRRKRSAKK